jgi:hypothetical protein
LGVFSLPGLRLLSEVWGKVEFEGDKNWSTARALCGEMIRLLNSAKLVTERANSDHAQTLLNDWQMPMYNIDFSLIEVSVEDLRERRELDWPDY